MNDGQIRPIKEDEMWGARYGNGQISYFREAVIEDVMNKAEFKVLFLFVSTLVHNVIAHLSFVTFQPD